jgi:hypothetical protein
MRLPPVLLLVAALLPGCALRAARPPPARDVTLAGHTAPLRDWQGARVCGTDPRALSADFQATSALLGAWLEATSAGPEGHWDAAHLSLLEQGPTLLPPLLEATAHVQEALQACPGDEALESEGRRVAEFLRQARRRLAEAPTLLTRVRQQQALESWRAAQPRAVQEAKSSWCPPRPPPGAPPEAFYAAQDETGLTLWYFCDGTRVSQPPGARPEVLPAASGRRGARRPAARAYLQATERFPSEEVQRAPTVPAPGARAPAP